MLILCSLPDFQLAVSLDFLYIWNWSPRLNFNPTGEVSERALREIYLKTFPNCHQAFKSMGVDDCVS